MTYFIEKGCIWYLTQRYTDAEIEGGLPRRSDNRK